MPREADSRPWPAPAKLNLFLHVTGRRADGYHDLQTLFQLLDWGDELRIGVTADDRVTRCGDTPGVPESADICLRAARLLKEHCRVRKGAHIELTKRIPVGGGLGGGSSDAATVLTALNELWSCGLSRRELALLGLQLGADVPVFIHGRSALAQGRGEELVPVVLGPRYYVLVFPPFGLSTAEVFAHRRLRRGSKKIPLDRMGLVPGRNDCLEAACELAPQLGKILRDLSAMGEPRMSGTGSTIFLPFADKNAAIDAAGQLKCRYNVRPVSGVDTSPLLGRTGAAE